MVVDQKNPNWHAVYWDVFGGWKRRVGLRCASIAAASIDIGKVYVRRVLTPPRDAHLQEFVWRARIGQDREVCTTQKGTFTSSAFRAAALD